VSNGDITECEASPLQTLDANDALSSTTGITWYTLATGGVVVGSPTLNAVGTVTYYAEYNDGTCSSLTRTAVTLTITEGPLAPVSNGDITECEASPLQTLDANDALSSTTGITWYTLATGGVVVGSPTLNAVGTVTYYAEYNDGTCSSLTRTAVTLTITGAPLASVSNGDITECEASPLQTLDANDALSSTVGITWYTLATGGIVVGSPTLNAVGTVTYYAEYNDGTCSSLTRTAVTLTITEGPLASVSNGDITECEASPLQTLDANDALSSTTGITWYTLATGGVVVGSPTLNAVGTVTYYAEYNDGTCSSLTRTAVTLTITEGPLAPVSNGDITECEASPLQTLDANDALSSTTGITWYTLATGGVVVGSPTLNAVGTVTYYAEYNDGTCSSLTRTAVTLTINDCSIAIVKTGLFVDTNGDQCADVGETIDYTFTVTNEGSASLSAIAITDALVAPITFVSGDTDGDTQLDVTETWIYTGTYTIDEDDIDAGQVTNTATAEGTAPDATVVSDVSGATTTDDDPTTTTLCQNPSIAIVKTGTFNDEDDDGCSNVGETISYEFTVFNTGNVTLTNITVTDPLVTVSGGPLASLAVGANDAATFTASYAITQADIDAGEVVNQATATGTPPTGANVTDLSDDASELEDDPTTTTLCQNPSIAIVKTGTFNDEDDDGCSNVGETISYEFTVFNTGNVTLTNITVTDPLVTVSGGPLASLAVGANDAATFTASYAITQADIDAGEVVNQATATGTPPTGANVTDLSDDASELEDDPTTTTLCQNPSIAIVKTGTFNDEDDDGCSNVGETISYEFTVYNTGNISLTNVNITDPLVTVFGGPISLAVGANDATTFTATYTITQADINAGEVVNQATAEGTGSNGDVVTDLSDDNSELEDDPTTTDICQAASIALIKTGVFNDEDQDGCADVKESITYSFTVINTGNAMLTNVDINDPLINVQGGPISLAPGASDSTTFTGTYLITQVDINNGEVVNQATATGTTPIGGTVTDLSDDNSELENDPTITDICQNPVIALIKTGTPSDENNNGCVDLGETIVYDFVVTNLGNVTLTDVIVTDPIVTVIGNSITILAGGSDTETFSAIYTVTQTDVDNGEVINQATAEGFAPNGDLVSDLSDNNSNFEDDTTVTILCQDPSISLEKTGVFDDNNSNQISEVGETITYVFSVTNTGNVTVYNIDITDALPGITISGGPIAQLLPGEIDTDTFTATYAITQEDIDAGEVVNQAIATGNTNPDNSGTEVTDESDDPQNTDNVDHNGDGDPDDPTVTIIPNVGGIADFEIYNGVTPDGDGLNDFFIIDGIQNFNNNNVRIYNRWGVLVWETDGYENNVNGNVFRGKSNGRATVREEKELPTGTYFYILTFIGNNPNPAFPANPGKESYNGYLYINR